MMKRNQGKRPSLKKRVSSILVSYILISLRVFFFLAAGIILHI